MAPPSPPHKYFLRTILIFTNHEGYLDPATRTGDRLAFILSTEVGQEADEEGRAARGLERVRVSLSLRPAPSPLLPETASLQAPKVAERPRTTGL